MLFFFFKLFFCFRWKRKTLTGPCAGGAAQRVTWPDSRQVSGVILSSRRSLGQLCILLWRPNEEIFFSCRPEMALHSLVAPVQTTNSAICPRCSAGLCVRHDVRTARGWRQRGQWSAQFRRLIPPLDFVILSLLWQKHQRKGTWHTLSASFRFSSSTNENTTLVVGLFPLFVTFHPGARYVRVLVALINGIWVILPSIALMEKSSRFPH